jgi:hypothetical protein
MWGKVIDIQVAYFNLYKGIIHDAKKITMSGYINLNSMTYIGYHQANGILDRIKGSSQQGTISHGMAISGHITNSGYNVALRRQGKGVGGAKVGLRVQNNGI